jgi:hypothetical protein
VERFRSGNLFERQKLSISGAMSTVRKTPMSNQAEHEHEPSKTLTAEELRQSLLSQIDATKEAVYALSDEEVEQVAGGMINPFSVTKEGFKNWSQQHELWVAENPQERSHLLGSGNPMATHPANGKFI